MVPSTGTSTDFGTRSLRGVISDSPRALRVTAGEHPLLFQSTQHRHGLVLAGKVEVLLDFAHRRH